MLSENKWCTINVTGWSSFGGSQLWTSSLCESSAETWCRHQSNWWQWSKQLSYESYWKEPQVWHIIIINFVSIAIVKSLQRNSFGYSVGWNIWTRITSLCSEKESVACLGTTGSNWIHSTTDTTDQAHARLDQRDLYTDPNSNLVW